MRIISGKFGGRRFYPPADKWPTRPTTDIAKEGLYNILQNWIYFEAEIFLDLFGGTGNHCYEFISRGCRDATYVDRHRPAVSFVRKTAKELQIASELTIYAMDVFRFIKTNDKKYTTIFAGPPYDLKEIPELPMLILTSGLLVEEGMLILEHNPNHRFQNNPFFEQVRNYGETHFSFFIKK